MTETSSPHDHRAQYVAALGFLLQLAAFGTLLAISFWSGSEAIEAASRFVFAGLPVWVILFLVFKQLRRVRAEQLETAEIRRAQAAGGSGAIFELDDEAVLLEQNRLRWMIRWMLPAVTVVVALILLLGHFVAWGWSMSDAFKPLADGGLPRASEPTLMMWFVVGVGFLCFLFARYALALARLPDWRLLHAGAAFMAGNAFVCLALAIALMASTNVDWAEPLVAYLVRAVMIVLGIELTLNFILDFYRPRQPGVVSRPSFDSRLLGLVSEPGNIARSIADAINYQFGFEVSSTWFYKLLQRWMFPMMVVTALVILALTSLVVVNAEEQAVIERFGRPVAARNGGVLSPGLHFKWPYPIEKVYRAPVKKVNELVIGEALEDEDEHEGHAVVWTEPHEYVPELMLLVGSPKSESDLALERSGARADSTESRSVAVSLLMVSVPIEYRIKDVRQYLHVHSAPEKLLEAVAYQILSDYAAGVDIDELMGPGREAFNRDLRGLIQTRLDELDAGVEVVFVGIRTAHPTEKQGVAAAFQAAISAQTRMAALIHAADGEARKILTEVAGTRERAKALDEAIRARDRLRSQANADPEALADARSRVDELLIGNPEKSIAPLSGEAAAMIAQARAQASRAISEASSMVRAFSTEVTAYAAAPSLYRQRKMLEIYRNLDHVRKFLILGNADNVIVEYESSKEGGLDEVLREGLEDRR